MSTNLASTAETSGDPATILVIEDSEDILDLIQVALAQKGYSIAGVSTEAQAFEAWQRCHGHVDLLITDVHLGVTGSGLTVAEQFLQLNACLKVLIVTGSVEPSFLQRIEADYHVIRKPFQIAELQREVERLLQARRTSLAKVPANR